MSHELTLLTILAAAHPRQVKRHVLEHEAAFACDEMTATDFDLALASLDRKRQIRIWSGEDLTRLSITDLGRERVAAAK